MGRKEKRPPHNCDDNGAYKHYFVSFFSDQKIHMTYFSAAKICSSIHDSYSRLEPYAQECGSKERKKAQPLPLTPQAPPIRTVPFFLKEISVFISCF